MDLNIVRLRIPLTAAGEQSLVVALASQRASIEQHLASLCTRSLSSDPELVRRHQKPGLPFVFSLPHCGMLDCLLVGPAIAELSSVVTMVVDRGGMTSPCQLFALDYQGGNVIQRPGGGDELPVLSLAGLLDLATPRYTACKRLQVQLQTPLRLVAAGRELRQFEPVRFVRGVLRRFSSLVAYYGIAGDPETFIRLADLAGRMQVVAARPLSVPQGQRGVLGSFEMQGPCEDLGPILELGALLHLGKGASFGMGAFQIRPLS